MPVRILRFAGAATCALALTLAAGATAGASTAHTTTPAPITTAPTVTGTVVDVGSDFLTVQTAGRRVGVIDALTAAATQITDEDTPYVWGGGHAEAGVASVGEKGPGYNGRRAGFDCSGSVAAVLAAAGLWPAGAGVPADNGVISELLAEHLIARGVGTAPASVTLYDDPGVHIFMNIDGRFFGTSDGSGGGDARGGAGWLDDGAFDATDPHFKKYHFLPTVLAQQTSDGSDYTFGLPDGVFAATERNVAISLGELPASDLLTGEHVRVTYSPAGTGAMTVQSVAVISGGPQLSPVSTTTPTVSTPTVSTPTVTTPTVTTPVATVPSVTVPSVTVTTAPAASSTTGVSASARQANSGGSALLDVDSGGRGLRSDPAAAHHHTRRGHRR